MWALLSPWQIRCDIQYVKWAAHRRKSADIIMHWASVSIHCVAFFPNTHLLFKHACDDLSRYSECIYDDDDDNDRKTTMMMMMMMVPSREKGLTLGTQSICAVLSGLAVPFAHLASVSGRWGVAFPIPLPLTLAAAYGPFAPLVPAPINCNVRTYANVDKEINRYTACVCAHPKKASRQTRRINLRHAGGSSVNRRVKDAQNDSTARLTFTDILRDLVQHFDNFATCFYKWIGGYQLHIRTLGVGVWTWFIQLSKWFAKATGHDCGSRRHFASLVVSLRHLSSCRITDPPSHHVSH